MSKWVNTSLGTLGKFSTSSVDKKILFGQKIVRLVNYMDVYNSNSIDSTINFMYVSASEVERARSQVKVGDILFTPSSETPDDIGYSAVVCENLENTLHSYHTVRYRPYDDQTFDIRFSAWFCNSIDIRKQFEQKCAGSTRYTLSIPSFTAVQISIPESKKEQRKIAKYLDIIQLTIEKTEALIAKYQLIKAGLMQDLFTRGIGVDGKLRPTREQAPELYYETKIGWIPKDWEEIRISDVLFKIDSGWSPACLEVQPAVGEWGVLKVSAVTRGFYDFTQSKTLPANLCPIPSLEVANGDVILTRANGVAELVGKTVQVKNTQTKLMLSDKLLRLVPNSDLMTKDYLALLMYSNIIKSQIDKMMSGSSGQRNISQSEIKSFQAIKPNKLEQDSISDKLLAFDQLIDKEKEFLSKLKVKKQGLMQDLLTGKKRVTINESEADHV